MNREEAINVLENEKKCVLRDSCERSECASCELVMPIERILSAYDMAIAALLEHEERENPNPLTLDELRQMDGEPVWIDDWYEDFRGWELSEDASDYFDGDSRTVESYGTRWAAYRSKPKEDVK